MVRLCTCTAPRRLASRSSQVTICLRSLQRKVIYTAVTRNRQALVSSADSPIVCCRSRSISPTVSEGSEIHRTRARALPDGRANASLHASGINLRILASSSSRARRKAASCSPSLPEITGSSILQCRRFAEPEKTGHLWLA